MANVVNVGLFLNLVHKIAAYKVRKTRTIIGPYFINTAHIVFAQKLARRGFINNVLILIGFQPFIIKLVVSHFKVLRNPVNIFPGIGWGHGFAAIGAA